MNRKRVILLGLTIFWTCMIWSLSLQPADMSDTVSSGLGSWLLETFLPGIYEQIIYIPKEQLDFWHMVLRKCAHFTEYFVLGIMWSQAISDQTRRYIYGGGLCVLTAVIDEMIQLFVPGRSGQVTDVLLDSAGALTGIAAAYLMSMILRYCVRTLFGKQKCRN